MPTFDTNDALDPRYARRLAISRGEEATSESMRLRSSCLGWHRLVAPAAPEQPGFVLEAMLSYKSLHGATQRLSLDTVGIEVESGRMWRIPASYRFQRNYPGSYWSSTTGSSIGYESLMEMRFLRTVDFGGAARSIRSQPFQLEAPFGDRTKRYTPDFLVVDRDDNVSVIEVKPQDALDNPEVVETLRWAAQLCTSRGWSYVLWSGASEIVEANLRFLAGTRNPYRVSSLVMNTLMEIADGHTIAEVIKATQGLLPSTSVLPHLSHLMWNGSLAFDLNRLIQESTRLVVRS